MKKGILFIAIALLSVTGIAQKFGHIDSQELLQLMPETMDAQKQIESESASFAAQIQSLQDEYQKIAQEVNDPNMLEALRQSKIQNAQTIEQNLYSLQQTAETSIRELQERLLNPIIEKAKNAIEAIGKEDGFTYIFDTSVGAVVYEGGENILPLAKAKLGIVDVPAPE